MTRLRLARLALAALLPLLAALPAAAQSVVTTVIPPVSEEPREERFSLTLFGGQYAHGSIRDIAAGRSRSADSRFVALAASRPIGRLGEHLRFEIEGQIGKHFGEQDHVEANALVIARWMTFPWDHVVDTSFAIGEGVSFASSVPPLENGSRRSSRLLNYILAELELANPAVPDAAFVFRLHHRSGVFGLYNGVTGASNLVTAGFKFRF